MPSWHLLSPGLLSGRAEGPPQVGNPVRAFLGWDGGRGMETAF